MKCIDPENVEDSGEKQRVDRRHPSGRTSVHAKWRAEPSAYCERMSDVAGFEQKWDYADGLPGMIVRVIPEISHSEKQRNCQDEPKRGCCCAQDILHVFICRYTMHVNFRLDAAREILGAWRAG